MDWKHFFIIMLRNFIITTALTIFVLGGIGFLLIGREGLLNGAIWGVIMGLASVPFMAGIIYMKYWGDFAGRYSKWHFDKETTGQED